MADDFVVQTKVEILKHSLGAVEQVLDARTDEEPQTVIDKLLYFPTEVSTLLVKTMKQVAETKEKTWALLDELDPTDELRDQIIEAWNSADGVDDALRELSKKVAACKGLASSLREVGLRDLTGNRADIKDSIVNLAGQLKGTLSTDNYFDSRSSAEGVLGEFVELLLGAAARSTRFGHDDSMADLFKIADALPALWPRVQGWSWGAITVPSLAERNEASESGILRIGYPEWSVWALPLLQYQFGYVYLRKRRDYAELAQVPGGVDALATVSAGPAYVLAALLFRIDPMAAGSGSTDTTTGRTTNTEAQSLPTDPVRPSDTSATLRSATMLRTLQEIARRDDQSTLGQLTERIIGSWRTAISAAGRKADAFDAALEADATKDRVYRAWWAAQKMLPSDAVGEPNLPRWAMDWAIVEGWATELATDPGTPDLAKFTGGSSLDAIPLLLNATWLARIGVQATRDAATDHLPRIADRAVECMLRVIDAGGRARNRRGRNL